MRLWNVLACSSTARNISRAVAASQHRHAQQQQLKGKHLTLHYLTFTLQACCGHSGTAAAGGSAAHGVCASSCGAFLWACPALLSAFIHVVDCCIFVSVLVRRVGYAQNTMAKVPKVPPQLSSETLETCTGCAIRRWIVFEDMWQFNKHVLARDCFRTPYCT